MKKYFFIIILFLLSCAPTEPVETHDDLSVLQDFINNSSGTLDMNLDINNSGAIDPTELGEQNWNDNGRITLLNCYNIGLSGGIPESIGSLTELTQLGLKNNNITGVIPESIGTLTNLRQLNLANNAFSGTIPDTIGNLKSLTHLVLSNNEFSGSIPNSIGELSILHTFLADSNNLSGIISDDICTVYPHFINYNLAGNKFCQSLPTCLDTPEKIGYQNCDTSCVDDYNFLNGYCYFRTDLTVLDSLIINQDSLNMDLDINSNGVIEPLELGYQKWFAGRLEKLDCHWVDTANCNLSISIPENIIELESLKYLNLQGNSLLGKLPDGLENLTALEYLNLKDNNLTGGVPETIGDLPALSTLKLQNNKIGCYEFDIAEDTCRVHCDDDIDICSGYVSENICEIKIIGNIDLSNNMLCPCYPTCIENDIGTQETSGCSYCNDGFIQKCDDLPESVTILEGDSLCFKIDNLAALEAFIDSSIAISPETLDISMLSDTTDSIDELIPLELGIQYWANGQLIYFDASNRGLSGGIPKNINNLDTLLLLKLSNNHLSGILPDSIYDLTNLSTLHLNGNNLSGEISPAICDLISLYWEADEAQVLSSNKSYLFGNKFCPPYPDCGEVPITSEESQECPDSSDDD